MEKLKCSRCKGTGIDPELENNQPCKKCSGLKKLDWIQNITGFELSREEKCILFTIKTLNELTDMGILTGNGLKIDERAKDLIKDFKPTKEEVELAIIILKREGHIVV